MQKHVKRVAYYGLSDGLGGDSQKHLIIYLPYIL